MDDPSCPCGLGDDYDVCCGRFHAGAPAPTAESLMRSRYSAFAVGDARYLLRTWHPSVRPETLELDPALRWTRLAVLDTAGGGLFDAAGTVSFRAVYVEDGQRGVLAENSSFARQDGQWSYLGPVV
ncbi:MAG TPA: YchJ family metal-binding protein [Trebonia sp.]|jgi:SEC-C motif-containing protein